MIKLILLSLAFLLISCTSKSGENLIKEVKADDFKKVKKIATQENVSFISEKGANFDYNEYDPELTALEAAILTYDYEMAEILLKKGASANIFTERSDGFRIYPFFTIVPKECVPPKMDKTSYDNAVKNLVPLLLKNGATLRNFIFPISKMCECKNQELVEFFVSIGFDPDWQFNDSTIGDYCRKQGVEITEEMIKNSSALEKTRKNEELKQKILSQIIRQQTEKDKDFYYYYYNEDDYPCTTIRAQTESFLFYETKKRSGKKKSSSFIVDTIKSKFMSVMGKEIFERFSSENRDPMLIRGAEYFSCKNTGFASDTVCLEQIDGQVFYREEKCPKPLPKRPRVTFSAPYLDPITNQVFVYKYWSSGSLGANSSLLVYELKSDGTLEYKYGVGLFRS